MERVEQYLDAVEKAKHAHVTRGSSPDRATHAYHRRERIKLKKAEAVPLDHRVLQSVGAQVRDQCTGVVMTLGWCIVGAYR